MDVPVPQPVRRIGRYELFGEFARGGMASVHLGRLVGPVGFARTVAIKKLHPGYANDPAVVRMFIDEARLASRIHHPNVVPIADVLAEGGDLFLVMDYIRGVSLAKLLKTAAAAETTLPLPIVRAIAIGLLSGLHAAHEAIDEDGEPLHVVHRDVSPQNVLVGHDGVTRVLDFGVAKAASRMQSTAEGQIKGKIAYMSPEQLGGSEIDRRSDLFAAGIVLWEMLTLRSLFGRSEPGAVITAVLTGAIELPSVIRVDVPEALDEVVRRALARSAGERFATALDMVRALEATGAAASPREVSEWLAGVAPEALEKASAAAAELEHASIVTAPVPPSLAPIAGVPPPESNAESIASTRIEAIATNRALLETAPSRFGPRTKGLAALALMVVLGVVVWASGSAISSADAPDANAPNAPTIAALRPAPTVAATSSPSPVPAASEEAVTPPIAAPSVDRRAIARGPARPRPAATGKAPSSRSDCKVLNADGTFGYRPECLK